MGKEEANRIRRTEIRKKIKKKVSGARIRPSPTAAIAGHNKNGRKYTHTRTT
jgi:hypothetical protein